jgi:hypothetical protein
MRQKFGSGGSADVTLSDTVTVTDSWAKHTVTFTLGSMSGKTIGANNYLYLFLNITPAGDGETFDLAQVQLCAGSVALPFQPKSFAEELRDCQRYYEKSYDYAVAPGTDTFVGALGLKVWATTSYATHPVFFKVTKRVTPTTASIYSKTGAIGKIRNLTAGTDLNASLNWTFSLSQNSTVAYVDNVSVTGGDDIMFHWVVEAEL